MRSMTSRLRSESGMTLIELMVAAMICAVGIGATIGVLDTSRTVSVKSELRQTMAHHAEREIERALELSWDEFAHTATPASSPTAGNPANYASAGGYAYDRSNPTAVEPWAIAPTGLVAGTSTVWEDGQTRLSGRIYRFVTELDPNARRLTVVVTGNGANAPAPILISSIKTRAASN